MFKTAILLSVIFTVIIKVNSLECYVCYDCLQVTDEYLTTCESLVPTSTSTAVPSTSTSTTPTSANSSTTSTSTESSSTTTPVTSTSTETSSSSTTTTSTTTGSNSTTTTTPTTTTESTSSNTTTSTTTTTEAPLNLSDNIGKADISFECFQGKIQVNTTDVIVRGCAAGRTNETCDSFGLTSCSFCSSNKCNSAAAIQSSVILLAVTFFTNMFRE